MRGGVLDHALLPERLDRRDARGAGERVARVGEPTGEEAVLDRLVDVVAHGHRAERDVAGVDPLRGRDDVRDDVPVVAGEPAARAAPARHHLVEDQQDPVAVADLADRLQVAVRRDDDPVRPGDRLEDDRGDRVRPLVLRISSRCGAPVQTGQGSGWPAGQRYVYGSNMRTTPGRPGSANQRRGSPVSVIAPAVAPWYER